MNFYKKNKHVVHHYAFQVGCYYVAWFATIFLAALNQAVWSAVVIWGFCAAQFAWQKWVDRRIHGLFTLCFILAAFGFIVDTFLIHTNWMIFNANPWQMIGSPPWMIGLWVSFAITYYATCQSFFRRYAILTLLCIIGFPLAYKAGAALGAATIYNHMTLVIIAIYGTALMLGTTYWINKKSSD